TLQLSEMDDIQVVESKPLLVDRELQGLREAVQQLVVKVWLYKHKFVAELNFFCHPALNVALMRHNCSLQLWSNAGMLIMQVFFLPKIRNENTFRLFPISYCKC
ncbi:hypothetical protein XENORESO_010861, partial [Xenotaenia resolanae]